MHIHRKTETEIFGTLFAWLIDWYTGTLFAGNNSMTFRRWKVGALDRDVKPLFSLGAIVSSNTRQGNCKQQCTELIYWDLARWMWRTNDMEEEVSLALEEGGRKYNGTPLCNRSFYKIWSGYFWSTVHIPETVLCSVAVDVKFASFEFILV